MGLEPTDLLHGKTIARADTTLRRRRNPHGYAVRALEALAS
jgi:hypothetical protein